MKKLFLFAAVMLAGYGAMAQTKADEVIKMDTEKIDFGKVKHNVPVSAFFTVTNVSDKNAFIENAWASCGCTTPEYSKAPIATGGTTKIKVGYNSATIGKFEKDVFIKVSGVQEPKIVKITGEVVEGSAYDAWTKTADYKKQEKAKLAQQGKLAKDVKKS